MYVFHLLGIYTGESQMVWSVHANTTPRPLYHPFAHHSLSKN